MYIIHTKFDLRPIESSCVIFASRQELLPCLCHSQKSWDGEIKDVDQNRWELWGSSLSLLEKTEVN
jgi:hypothetical protein